MNKLFDPERLLATLPFRPVDASENLLEGYKPPAWRYPLLGTYNGFSGEQRVRAWQLGTWLRRRGLLSIASCCDLCGSPSRLGRHSENYADIERAVTICERCHLALHKRFWQPEAWRRQLSTLQEVPEWAVALSPTPIDLPRWLSSIGAPSDPFEKLRKARPNDLSISSAASIPTR